MERGLQQPRRSLSEISADINACTFSALWWVGCLSLIIIPTPSLIRHPSPGSRREWVCERGGAGGVWWGTPEPNGASSPPLFKCRKHLSSAGDIYIYIPRWLLKSYFVFHKRNSYRFGTTWGWVNDIWMFIFGWTIPGEHDGWYTRTAASRSLFLLQYFSLFSGVLWRLAWVHRRSEQAVVWFFCHGCL